MNTKDFYFDLPKELIAQTPLEDRAASRMLRLDRNTGSITHTFFRKFPEFLLPGDCLVLNDTKVIPARLHGVKSGTGTAAEILLLERKSAQVWEALVKPGKKLRAGDIIVFGVGELTGGITEALENGNRLIEFSFNGVFEEILDRLGEMPLPPYITQKLSDRERYQTVYSRVEGSAAAPTAGLHFTEEMLGIIGSKGVNIARLTLHVGLGTFRPVKAQNIKEHHMHSEYYSIDAECCSLINNARENGHRVIAVGTTSCRALESASDENGFVEPTAGYTDIFIYPGYRFKAVDGIITNFHLPESTLIMLISAFSSREAVLAAYNEAVKERYRFFSFGDVMFID